MDYADCASALVRAWAEYPPRWDFSNWNYRTNMGCSPEETYSIHDYGVELRRRAWTIVATQCHRDTADVSHEQVERRTDDRGASAKESGALLSSQSSLNESASSEESGVLLKQQPQPKQTTHHEEEERRKPKEQDDEDQQLVFMEEG